MSFIERIMGDNTKAIIFRTQKLEFLLMSEVILDVADRHYAADLNLNNLLERIADDLRGLSETVLDNPGDSFILKELEEDGEALEELLQEYTDEAQERLVKRVRKEVFKKTKKLEEFLLKE